MQSLICLLTLASKIVSALNPVLIKGNVFYDVVTKERVFLKGVDYQPLGEQGVDPLIDPEQCARDLFLMQQLGVNVMRVYTVDPEKDHDECMSMYNAGGVCLHRLSRESRPDSLLTSPGIYLMLDVNAGHPGRYLNRLEPWTTYNKEYVTNVFSVMQVFSGYSNRMSPHLHIPESKELLTW